MLQWRVPFGQDSSGKAHLVEMSLNMSHRLCNPNKVVNRALAREARSGDFKCKVCQRMADAQRIISGDQP